MFFLGWVRGNTTAFVGQKSISFDGHIHEIVQVNGLQNEINSLKTSVSEGKSLIAAAVTGKGVPTAADATFQTIASNIAHIASAPMYYRHIFTTGSSSGQSSFSLNTNTGNFVLVYENRNAPETGGDSGVSTSIYDMTACLIHVNSYPNYSLHLSRGTNLIYISRINSVGYMNADNTQFIYNIVYRGTGLSTNTTYTLFYW